MKFKVGDRVTRSQWDAPTLRGTVTEVYEGVRPSQGPTLVLIAVRWDGRNVESRGYFEDSLQHEPNTTGIVTNANYNRK